MGDFFAKYLNFPENKNYCLPKKGVKMKRQFKLSLTAFAIAQCLSLASAQAQETVQEQQATTTNNAQKVKPKDTDKQQNIEVLTVQGFGATLQRSLQNKKLADSTVEVISVDDIGQLPDVTITDALARLPGDCR
ncbi:MAG: hypothetical protein LRY40_04375 [Shewanella fodinae]|nr:hypothetical protein [Shewanella fodinae]